MESKQKFRAVKYDKYGDIDVLHIEEVPVPVPGKTQALVRVRAAGINPGEASIREGLFAKQWPATFPSGQGTDFAGIVEKIGDEIKDLTVGEEVIGFTNDRASQAEYVLVDAKQLVHRPAGVSWEEGGSLFVAGTTAYAAVQAVDLNPGDTLVVSGAAGGVGSIAVQLARNAGARVIGLASKTHHPWLLKQNITPVTYGPGVADRIRSASAGRVDAFIDTFGGGYVELALELGAKPDRIDTIIDFKAAGKYHVKTAGNSDGGRPEVLAELARMIDEGDLEIPIARVYHLNEVRDAYRELAKRHTHGKVVLVP
ncbi:MAG TPA: NADP-dependent oxidoreductase [Puia sp.]|jgi:NADPH:quinone reductase-like Zn-dependent oxidoreductase|nr:NADP-dependent oxidoreductase [Puia sp.]